MSGVNRFIQKFNNIADETDAKLKKNPFSDTYEEQTYDIHASDYGRPLPGSLTEKRGIKAGAYILNEVVHLCEIIVKYGYGPEDSKCIKFGPLFKIYEFYSDKVVGLLIRARKYKLLDFDGEMLYQRQDDHKVIQMLMSIEDIYENVKFSGDPKNVVHVANRPPSEQIATPIPKSTIKKVARQPSEKARERFKQTELQQPRSSYYNFCI